MATGITVSYGKDWGFHVLTFAGEINQTELQKNFSDAYTLIGDMREAKVVFDLSKVPYINSGFIGYVSELYAKTDENKGKLVIIGNPTINDTFDLVGMWDFVSIVADQNAALDTLRQFIKAREYGFAE